MEEKDWSEKKNIERELLDPVTYNTIWYKKWEECFLETWKFGAHELVDQPLLFFYLVSAEDENPDAEIQRMCNLKSSIRRYQEGTYHSDYPHIYLMLHDKKQEVSSDVAMMKIEKLRKKYARGFNYCDIWSMDFSPGDSQGYDEWARYLRLNRISQMSVLDSWDRKSLMTIDDKTMCKLFMKEIIDEKLINTVASKVRHYEHMVKNTKKGFTNMLKGFISKKERSENDGLKKDFIMNSQELSMKNLIDLSFLFQDYKTYGSYLKYPINDFKSTKAYRHVSSCYELQYFSYLLSYPNYSETREFTSNLFQAANSYTKAKEPKWMIRNLLICAEMCKAINKYEEAGKCYLKIAYSLSSSSWLPALFFEQAAYCFLKIDQQRKFSFYIVKAGIVYEDYDYKDYSFYCFSIAEPYYTKFKWNQIRNFLYTSLSQSSFYFGNLQLSVKFFRNLLQLCWDIEDSIDIKTSQKECLNQFFTVVQNWNECRKKQESELISVDDGMQSSITNIGFLSLPKFLDDLLEVVLSDELNVTYSSDLSNQNNNWRMMIRQAMTHIENQEEENAKNTEGLSKIYQSSRDEKFEIGLYDAANRYEKKLQALKKVRKVYAKEPIIVKVFVKNPLMTDVEISKIFLNCKFIMKDNKNTTDDISVETMATGESDQQDFITTEQKVILKPSSIKEIILEVTPMKEGEIFILGIEWVLFNAVSWNYYFPTNYPNDKANDENTSKKLKGRENMFHYEVQKTSANLQMFFDEKLSKMFYHTEYTDIDVTFLNESEHPVKKVYLKCSNPMLFGFSWIKIADEIQPQEQINKKLWFRAVGYVGTRDIKFLARYLVEKDNDTHARTTRVVKEINITKGFNFKISTINNSFEVQKDSSKSYTMNSRGVDRDAFENLKINQLALVKGNNKWVLSMEDFNNSEVSQTIAKFFNIQPHGDAFEFGTGYNRQRSSSLLLERSASNKVIDFEESPYSDFIEQEYKFFKNSTKHVKEFDTNELEVPIIAIAWSIYKKSVCNIQGFQCIFGIVPTSQVFGSLSSLESKESVGSPLYCSVKFEKNMFFDFSDSDFWTIPLDITITNILNTRSVTFWIEAEQSKRIRNKNDYFWTGVTKKNIKTLAPNDSIDIQFTACFTEPGVYDLNKLRLTIFQDSSTNEIIQTYEEKKMCQNIIPITKQLEFTEMIVQIE